MNKKISVILIVSLILVSSFCLTACNVNNKCEAEVVNCDSEVMTFSDDMFYSETGTQDVEIETISYSRKEATSYVINYPFPNYYNTNLSLTNACANVAGANVIGYYDRYFDDFIPDYTTGIMRTTGYYYYPMSYDSDKKQVIIDLFYKTMKTNTKNNGTSQEDCQSALKDYVQSKGRSLTYKSVLSNKKFSFDKFDSELRDGNPVMMFLNGYNIVNLVDSGSQESIYKNNYAGNHIVIAYGYEIIDYYDSSNKLIKSNTYILISTGIDIVKGHYLLNGGGNIIAAEAVAVK